MSNMIVQSNPYTTGLNNISGEEKENIKNDNVGNGSLPDNPSSKDDGDNDIVHLAPADYGCLSQTALAMALMTECSAEQRKANKEQMQLATDAIVKTMETQADDMHSKAAKQMALGITSAVMSIAAGALSMTSSIGTGLGKTGGIFGEFVAAGINTAGQGMSGTFSAGSEYVGTTYDAGMKEYEAKIEELRNSRDMTHSFNDSLKELIQKTLSTMDAIQQNTNQTRAKILG